MRVTSAEENLQAKEAYERLSATHRSKVLAYRAESIIFSYYLFKEALQTCRHQMR